MLTEPVFFGLVGAVGLFLCVLGYRLFHVALSLVGVLSGAIYGIGVMQVQYGAEQLWPVVVGGLTGAVLGGGLAVGLYYIGIFAAGGYLGAILAGVILDAFPIDYPLMVLVGLAVLCGLLTLALQKTVLILLTSVVGAWHAVAGFFYFRGGLELIPFSHPYQDGVWLEQISVEAMGAWAGASIIGFVVQNWFTGKIPKKTAPRRRERRKAVDDED